MKSFSVHIRPEKSLKVLWELSPASITWVQSDKNSHRWPEVNLLSEEMKPENTKTQLQISNMAHSAQSILKHHISTFINLAYTMGGKNNNQVTAGDQHIFK